MTKRSKFIEIDFDKVVEFFNLNGKEATQEYTINTYNLDYNAVYRRLTKESSYSFNKSSRKYELKSSNESNFMTLDELCKEKNIEPSRSNPQEFPPTMDIESIIVDLMKDRITELSKYININQASKKILINLQNLEKSGYEIRIT